MPVPCFSIIQSTFADEYAVCFFQADRLGTKLHFIPFVGFWMPMFIFNGCRNPFSVISCKLYRILIFIICQTPFYNIGPSIKP